MLNRSLWDNLKVTKYFPESNFKEDKSSSKISNVPRTTTVWKQGIHFLYNYCTIKLDFNNNEGNYFKFSKLIWIKSNSKYKYLYFPNQTIKFFIIILY